MNLIETKDLCKRYGDNLVINHVDMHIPEKAIYGFVGENGSGKTTIMRLLTGLAEVTSGEFTMFGVSNKDRNIHATRQQVSAIVETPSLVPHFTAKQNMRYQELYEGLSVTEQERDNLLKKVHLDNVGNKKVKNYSLGMRQRLAIALALLKKPKVMFLDEPMNGLDPEGIAELRELLIELNKSIGITVLISSHILSELEKIATCYGFISHGRLLEEITTEELQKRCKKSLNLVVDDISKAEKVLKNLKLKDYDTLPNGTVRIFDGNLKTADIVIAFDKAGLDILSINSNEGSVEDYYLNLVKGVN